MIIRCPECQFERSIDSSKIPHSAAIATCPKCRHRFRFRALAPDTTPGVTSDDAPVGNAALAAQAPLGPQDTAMPPRRALDDAASGDMHPLGQVTGQNGGQDESQNEDDDLPAAFRRGSSADLSGQAGQSGQSGQPDPTPGMADSYGAFAESGTDDHYAGEDDHVGEPRPLSDADTPHLAAPGASRTAASSPDAAAPNADAPDNAHGHTDRSRPGDDPLPPGAVIPGRGSNHAPAEDRDDSAGTSDGQRRSGTPRDIWDAVASVGDRWRKQAGHKSPPDDRKPGAYDAHDGNRNADRGPDRNQDFGANRNDGGYGAPYPPHEGGHPGERDAPLPPWAASARNEVPWENLDRLGFFPGLYQTILRVMLAAPRFFSGVRSAGSLKRPVAFYLLIGIFQALTERLWYLMSVRAFGGFIEDPQLHAWMGSVTHDMSLPMTLLLSPFTLLLQLAVLASVYHFMIRLVEPRAADFPTTVRVISYSAAPTVLSVVPLVGPVVGSLWFIICTFVGVKYAHRLPWSRTALAIGPLLGLGFALTVQLLRMFMSSAPM